jgi:hypothetical protein
VSPTTTALRNLHLTIEPPFATLHIERHLQPSSRGFALGAVTKGANILAVGRRDDGAVRKVISVTGKRST